ncbi:DUF3244 domain-containing protein [uncultured Parabacteroides sp.]|uniref:DUF3244 domain-containing protein n=1 Tax=uncultured Parabacteroides sp. TaxID=512312 RepID=UPI0028044F3C|nr:DUF3244 domain-containing protein [uncultured Parabacteroides sp.]
MRTGKKIITWTSRVVVTFLLSISIGLLGHANETKAKIIFEGKWDELERSISHTFSVSAYIKNDLLLIQSSTLRSEITVTIIKSGTIVYEQTISADQTANVGISVTEWKEGTYTLELRNQWGGYLYGNFFK